MRLELDNKSLLLGLDTKDELARQTVASMSLDRLS